MSAKELTAQEFLDGAFVANDVFDLRPDYRVILMVVEGIKGSPSKVVTQNSSPRALHVDDLAELAEQIYGEERIHRIDTMPSAVELAAALAEETDSGDGIVSGSGVVVTGSVVAAGEARTLFGKDPQ